LKKPLIILLFLLVTSCLFTFHIPLVKALTYEDFTTYTEVDPDERINTTANHLDYYTVGNEDSYLYKDMGVGHFGDLEHFLDAKSDFETVSMRGIIWMVANDLDDEKGLTDADKPFLEVFFFNSAGTPTYISAVLMEQQPKRIPVLYRVTHGIFLE